MAWYSIKAAAGRSEIAILDDIGAGAITAKDFKASLDALGKVNRLDISIHSSGGDVSDGVAIYNMLVGHPARKTVTVLGLAASIASVVAMAGNEVLMPDNALMMVHEPWGGIVGRSSEVRKYADTLDVFRDSIIGAYTRKTGLSAAKVKQLLADETWLSADEAVKLGFADRVVPSIRAAASLDVSKFKRPPAAALKAARGPVTFDEMAPAIYARYNRRT